MTNANIQTDSHEQADLGRDVDVADSTLADLVNAAPATARILQSYGLDFCCGGGERLADACARLGIETSAVINEVQSAACTPDESETNWTSLSITQLVDHIESTHHAYLHSEFDRIAALAAKVAGVHGQRHPELLDVESTYAALMADFEPHLVKEERVLFPMIRELDAADASPSFHCGSLRNPISVMMHEHDRAGELLADLRRLTHEYEAPADGCGSFRELYRSLDALEIDTHLHVHKENNLLFPAVLAQEAQKATDPESRS